MAERTFKGNPLLRGERLQIMLEAAELRAVDDFRFANRLPSRAAAVRELLRRGLASPDAHVRAGNSRSYGVLDDGPRLGEEAERENPSDGRASNGSAG